MSLFINHFFKYINDYYLRISISIYKDIIFMNGKIIKRLKNIFDDIRNNIHFSHILWKAYSIAENINKSKNISISQIFKIDI
jgi:hypothetical protein